jgi:hypothetical protein
VHPLLSGLRAGALTRGDVHLAVDAVAAGAAYRSCDVGWPVEGRARPVAAWMFDIALAGFVIALTVPLVREVALAGGGRLVGVATVNAAVHAGVLILRRPRCCASSGRAHRSHPGGGREPSLRDVDAGEAFVARGGVFGRRSPVTSRR